MPATDSPKLHVGRINVLSFFVFVFLCYAWFKIYAFGHTACVARPAYLAREMCDSLSIFVPIVVLFGLALACGYFLGGYKPAQTDAGFLIASGLAGFSAVAIALYSALWGMKFGFMMSSLLGPYIAAAWGMYLGMKWRRRGS
jgi:hypothetical protein